MGYWISLLLLLSVHSSLALPTAERETNHGDVAADWQEQDGSAKDSQGLAVVAHEIATRVQDPTENLVCRLFEKVAPRGLIMVPATHGLLRGYQTLFTTDGVGLREYLYSPAVFAALCVSPEKPKPFPLFFAPPAPVAAPSVSVVVPQPTIGRGPTLVPTVIGSALSSPAPAIPLVFSSPVGSIGISSVGSPAVNIATPLTNRAEKPSLLLRKTMLP